MAVSWEEYRKHKGNIDWVIAHEGEIDWKEVRRRESAEELKHALRELAPKLGVAVLMLSYPALFFLLTDLLFPHLVLSTPVFVLLLLLYSVVVPVLLGLLYYAVLLKLLRLALKRLLTSEQAIMNPQRLWEVALTMLWAILLLIASDGRHFYGFYMVLRLVITVGAVYWACRVYEVGLWAWSWVFAAVALLFNPFLPIRMQRSQWQPIDLWLGVLAFVWCGYWLIRKGIKYRWLSKRTL